MFTVRALIAALSVALLPRVYAASTTLEFVATLSSGALSSPISGFFVWEADGISDRTLRLLDVELEFRGTVFELDDFRLEADLKRSLVTISASRGNNSGEPGKPTVPVDPKKPIVPVDPKKASDSKTIPTDPKSPSVQDLLFKFSLESSSKDPRLPSLEIREAPSSFWATSGPEAFQLFRITETAASPVPLPATVWLLGPAIGALGLMRKKAA